MNAYISTLYVMMHDKYNKIIHNQTKQNKTK